MRAAIAILGCAGIACASQTAIADSIYRRCGASATGFVEAKGRFICIGQPTNGNENIQAETTPVRATSNTSVDDSLNLADLATRDGRTKQACDYVEHAIFAANNFPGTSENQKQQLRAYATRCNLRYNGN